MRHEYDAENMTIAISTAIKRFLNEEEKEAMHKNSSKYQSSEINAKKKTTD